MNYLTVLVWGNSSLFCTERNLFWLIVCFMRTKTVCLKMHLNYATAFLKIPFQSYNYAVKLTHTFTVDSHISVMVTFWEPPSGPGNTIQDSGIARHAIQFVQEDGTWSNTKAVRCLKELHTYTLIWHKRGNTVGRVTCNVHKILGWFGQKSFIIYNMQQSCLEIGECFVKEYWSAVSMK